MNRGLRFRDIINGNSSKGRSKDLGFSNHNALSLKANLKKRDENIESRMTKSLENR
jgi:hypothetical protein